VLTGFIFGFDIHSFNDRTLLSAGGDRPLQNLLDLQPQRTANKDLSGNFQQAIAAPDA
jgi:hypothetical protein